MTTPNQLGQGVMAVSMPVAIASDQTVFPVSIPTPVPVTDNGGSLTVDSPQLPAALVGGRLSVDVGASVLPTGAMADATFTGRFPAAVAAGDAVANPTATEILAFLMGYDPVANNWGRIRSNPDDSLQAYRPSTLSALVAGAANAIATLTLPAAGAGLFHYITALRISRVATAALAGGAILVVTTTNLGGRSWRTGNVMAAGGTTDLLNIAFPEPIKSAVANTATTIVGPAPGVAVSWDMEVEYFTGA